jgi:alanine racemase
VSRPARALLRRRAALHNLTLLRRAAGGSRLLAVVKANAYGHGLTRVAPWLEAAEEPPDGFAVACLEEAVALRETGVAAPIALLEGVFEARELAEAARLSLIVMVHAPWQVEALAAARPSRPLAVWLKVDTGMHRLGFPPQQVPAVLARLEAMPQVRGPVVLTTHLACADDPDAPETDRQLEAFAEVTAGHPNPTSIANSAALLSRPTARGDWVRPGIALYGASPFAAGSAAELGLTPVMQLTSRLIAVNPQRRGAAIGYGATWTCPEDMPVGVVAAGYGDGYPRHAPNGTPVLVTGRPAPLVGRVSMDMLCVDLRGHPSARVGDEVVLWGDGLPVDEVARRSGTIAYEVLCGVAGRVAIEEEL